MIKNRNLLLAFILFLGCTENPEPVFNSLINLTVEGAGSNCENGGVRIDTGLDVNRNGVLDEEETTSTQFVCNGLNGTDGLLAIMQIASGDNCENGGIQVNSGLDRNKNGLLDEDEIQHTAIICNGKDGSDSIMKVTSESPSENCMEGGIKIESGKDENANGILEDGEVSSTTYVCNGEKSTDQLVKLIKEPAGSNCSEGGVRVLFGRDSNNNNELDSEEVMNTTFVCNGTTGKEGPIGTTGSNGASSVVRVDIEQVGANCPNGGVKIVVGHDNNRNGLLDNDEVSTTRYVCNGVAEPSDLISVQPEPAGNNCEFGGIRVIVGKDRNSNGILDTNEFDQIEYLCNSNEKASKWREVTISLINWAIQNASDEERLYTYSAIALSNSIVNGWNHDITNRFLTKTYETIDNKGYGINEAWDAFQDGTINDASTNYTVTMSAHAGNTLLAGYRNGIVPKERIDHLIQELSKVPEADGLPNGKCLAYSANDNDRIGCVHNVNINVAYFYNELSKEGLATSQMVAMRDLIIEREKYSYLPDKMNWLYWDRQDILTDQNHLAFQVWNMYYLDDAESKELAKAIIDKITLNREKTVKALIGQLLLLPIDDRDSDSLYKVLKELLSFAKLSDYQPDLVYDVRNPTIAAQLALWSAYYYDFLRRN